MTQPWEFWNSQGILRRNSRIYSRNSSFKNSSLGNFSLRNFRLGNSSISNSRIPYYVIPQPLWGISIWNSSQGILEFLRNFAQEFQFQEFQILAFSTLSNFHALRSIFSSFFFVSSQPISKRLFSYKVFFKPIFSPLISIISANHFLLSLCLKTSQLGYLL